VYKETDESSGIKVDPPDINYSPILIDIKTIKDGESGWEEAVAIKTALFNALVRCGIAKEDFSTTVRVCASSLHMLKFNISTSTDNENATTCIISNPAQESVYFTITPFATDAGVGREECEIFAFVKSGDKCVTVPSPETVPPKVNFRDEVALQKVLRAMNGVSLCRGDRGDQTSRVRKVKQQIFASRLSVPRTPRISDFYVAVARVRK
jgi:hypothetical protein